MRPAFILRHRRRLLMQLDPRNRLPSSSSPSSRAATSTSTNRPHLKRSFAHLAEAKEVERDEADASFGLGGSKRQKEPRVDRDGSHLPELNAAQAILGRGTRSAFSSESDMPPGPSSGASHNRASADPFSWRSKAQPGGGSAPGSRTSSHSRGWALQQDRRGGKKRKGLSYDVVEGPMHTKEFIEEQYRSRALKPSQADNPASPVSNWCMNVLERTPEYTTREVILGDRKVWRSTLYLEAEPIIVAIGDAEEKKAAQKLAALSACYQLDAKGQLESTTSIKQVEEVKLSDGSIIDYDRARQFMDYYCRRYKFSAPDLELTEVKQGRRGRSGNSSWEGVMSVGGRRIGIGKGSNKKAAQVACYLDVAQYLESCDPELWKTFVEAAKTGKDLGPAPRVIFGVTRRLDDHIRDLCHDIRKSALYANRPTPAHMTASNAAAVEQGAKAPMRHPPAAFMEDKSARLLKRRKNYLADPNMAKMRATRATLPVYSKSKELLDQIEKEDVTICMAATGSGKTTQVPQLILDQWIERGEGAKCNIVCTQPRRLAAISVADRVAKERGEECGRGTVGYQVRFEEKRPEEHGSITFCTTGVFLKRLQSFMGEGIHDLDSVSHIVVDEVHERDVDTDLLLMVLKRLMMERREQGKSLKIVLMSATIDPTLFQQYFGHKDRGPAKVVEIPGRSFPVQKHFMDEFVPQMAKDPRTSWVFRENPVVQYISREMPNVRVPNFVPKPVREGRDDELEIPYPLVALTIAHVLKQSEDGHVLVFLPGWEEISAVNRCLLDRNAPFGLNFLDDKKYSIHLLHSTIPLAEQQVIFQPPPDGVRRIILATNIAETSVTIPDVVYVVDTAKLKENRYDPERHISSLISAWVGSSNLNQRAGRAGRHRPGEYYGILGSERAESLHPYQTVEMKRVDLQNVVMHVKALNLSGMTIEEVLGATIEPPSDERVRAALQDLRMAGALDENKNLTSLGRILLQIPIEVQMGRLVLFGSFFRCLDQTLTLAAILTNRDPFLSPPHLRDEAHSKKASWSPPGCRSDALAAVRAYNAWWRIQSQGRYVEANKFCLDNFLSKPTLLLVEKVKHHLLQAVYRAGIIDVSAGGDVSRTMPRPRGRASGGVQVPEELNVNGDCWPLLAALMSIALQPKFAVRTGERTLRTQQDKAVFIHPSSVNSPKMERYGVEEATIAPGERQLFNFVEKRRNVAAPNSSNAQTYIVTTTRIDPMSYMLFGAYDIEVTEEGLVCDEWLPIVGPSGALDNMVRLKGLLEACMLRVFHGLLHRRNRPGAAPEPDKDDDEFDDDESDDGQTKDYSLSAAEVKELDSFTNGVVQILSRYDEERAVKSRAASPAGSGRFVPSSGRSTPTHPMSGFRSAGSGSAFGFSSRPGTPSRLSRGYWN